MTQQRTPKGVPAGGQFSGTGHGEAAVDLGETDPVIRRRTEPWPQTCHRGARHEHVSIRGVSVCRVCGRVQGHPEYSVDVQADGWMARVYNSPRPWHRDPDIDRGAEVPYRQVPVREVQAGDQVQEDLYVSAVTAVGDDQTHIGFEDSDGRGAGYTIFNNRESLTFGQVPEPYAQTINDRLVRLQNAGTPEQIAAVWSEAARQFAAQVDTGEIAVGDSGKMSGVLACLENALDIKVERP